MKKIILTSILLFGITSLFRSSLQAETVQCINILDRQYNASLTVIEMRRHIQAAFEEITEQPGSIFQASTITLHFGVDNNKQPVGIQVTSALGSPSLKQGTIDAVKNAAPFRQAGECLI